MSGITRHLAESCYSLALAHSLPTVLYISRHDTVTTLVHFRGPCRYRVRMCSRRLTDETDRRRREICAMFFYVECALVGGGE